MREYPPFRCAQGRGHVNLVSAGRCQSARQRHHDREKPEQSDQQYFRRDTEAEPDNEQRRNSDDRNGLRDDENRDGDTTDRANRKDDESQAHTAHECEHRSQTNFKGGDPGGFPDIGRIIKAGVDNRRGRRHKAFVDVERAHRHLPRAQEQHHKHQCGHETAPVVLVALTCRDGGAVPRGHLLLHELIGDDVVSCDRFGDRSPLLVIHEALLDNECQVGVPAINVGKAHTTL